MGELDWPTPHNAAAARYELEQTMALVESIAALALADCHHQPRRIEYCGPGWAETIVCSCGDWIAPDQSWDAHVIGAAQEFGEDAA